MNWMKFPPMSGIQLFSLVVVFVVVVVVVVGVAVAAAVAFEIAFPADVVAVDLSLKHWVLQHSSVPN